MNTKSIYRQAVTEWLISPISALEKKFDPLNTEYACGQIFFSTLNLKKLSHSVTACPNPNI